eukprot:6463178-Prymnesium_polylepis.2
MAREPPTEPVQPSDFLSLPRTCACVPAQRRRPSTAHGDMSVSEAHVRGLVGSCVSRARVMAYLAPAYW